MKLKDLIARLQRIDIDEFNTVYLHTTSGIFNFSGFSVDDKNDVQLYIVHGDEKA